MNSRSAAWMPPADIQQGLHYWFGCWVPAHQLENLLESLPQHLDTTLPRQFPQQALLQACDQIGRQLQERSGCYDVLLQEACRTISAQDADPMLQGMAAMLRKDAMQEKLRSELGDDAPGMLKRRYPGRQYEAWAPCGCVVHVAPSNVFTAAAMGLVEGLMAGNVNVVKTSARDGMVAALFASALVQEDISGALAAYIAVLRLPSSHQKALQQLFAQADVVSAWGGEKAVAAVRALVPAHARLVTWGHKLSFAYVSAECLAQEGVWAAVARDVCRLDQQACSSPQTVMVETDAQGLKEVARQLAAQLALVSPSVPRSAPDMAEQAEITTVLSVARAEAALGLTQVIEDEEGQWRIIVDQRPGLRPSPLFRTIWLKPVERSQLAGLLRPMRAWLQTCGLAAERRATAHLSRLLLSAGVSRVTRLGEMVDSYLGAPHDGVYALQQLARRVSVDGGADLAYVGCLDTLTAQVPDVIPRVDILDKDGFQALGDSGLAQDPKAGLLVRSGGSSGKTAYSSFRWADYHTQMAGTADGLVAAGLVPETDRVMNLFAAGSLYGSFISFWSVLEHLQVMQLPMGMVTEFDHVADQIIEHRANVLLGMTPHLLALFKTQGARLKAWGGVEKVFYGGESMSEAQLQFLMNECGVPLVRSAAYGSNDAGPMGYQCLFSHGGVHHLNSRLQALEIVEMESDAPVQGDAIGRLLLTPKARSAPVIERYEIGDIGRWVHTACACGSQEPRFELMGRMGDVFKAAGPLMNYGYFVKTLSNNYGYAGPVQLHLRAQGVDTLLDIWVDDRWDQQQTAAAQTYFWQDYEPLQTIKSLALPLSLCISVVAEAQFERNAVSGKLRHVCEHRSLTTS